jgi:hypothetical protein
MSETEASAASAASATHDLNDDIRYVGPSMRSTFAPGDVLILSREHARPVSAGDVIVCRPPGRARLVIHRVVAVTDDGICTRGDDNPTVDPWVLRSEDVLGRVTRVRRGRRERMVLGGRAGQAYAWATRGRRQTLGWLRQSLRLPYAWLCRRGGLHWLPFRLRTRVVCFERRGGMEWQLLVGRTTIGWWRESDCRWHMRAPFGLIVDESGWADPRSASGGTGEHSR